MSTTVAERRRFEQRQRLTRIVATTSSNGVVSSSDERENKGVELWFGYWLQQWWSVGTILFELNPSVPPFTAEHPEVNEQASDEFLSHPALGDLLSEEDQKVAVVGITCSY
nr:probable serine/threonine protein kinase IRE4 isoform X3 [Ipomoea batatas]